jgi:hypothetical protein
VARYVISVGGTGQHLALALTRLARLGAVKDLRLIALDSDNETALPQKLTSPTPSLSGARHPLIDGVVKPPFDVARLGKKTFGEMFLDADHPDERELFECLFEADEARIPIHKGMFGTPCVGATVFSEGAGGAGLKNLLSPLSAATQVFVCGSVVGGTGAGVMHKLIQEIRSYYSGEIFGVFMLPWFTPPGGSAPGSITPALIERNKTHGVKYFYEYTIPKLTASLLIGYPGNVQTSVLRPLALKDGDMGEHPSYLHLAAVRGMLDLPAAHTANRTVKAYGMSHDRNHEGALLDLPWETSVPLRRLVRAMRVQHNLLSFLTLDENVDKIMSYWSAWVGEPGPWVELEQSIKNNVQDKKQRGPMCQQVLDRFRALAEEAEFCVSWAQQLFPGDLLDVPNDSLMLELSENYKRRHESAFHWDRIRGMWASGALKADPNKARDASEIADHHAQLIWEAGMKP